MKQMILLMFACLLAAAVMGQNDMNLSFERLGDNGQPDRWTTNSINWKKYTFTIDSLIVFEGKYAYSISSNSDSIGDNDWAACSYILKNKYQGKKISLKGYLKTASKAKAGGAFLWMQIIDKNGRQIQLENMESRLVAGTQDWKEYSIELPLDETADLISFGGGINGFGKVWVDDMHVFIDGIPIDRAPLRTEKIVPALTDSAFNAGSKIALDSVTDRQIENLSVLGKVWGFLKYYHPKVAIGDYNWDFELFRVIPGVLACKNTGARDELLINWIKKLGPIKPCNSCDNTIPDSAKLKPDFSWISDKYMGTDLRNALEYIKQNRNQGDNYYAMPAPVGNPLFKNERAYPEMDYPDAGYRLMGLFRFWNIIQYYFPYKYAIVEDNWNNVLPRFIPKFVGVKNRNEYYLVLKELIAKIHDTHANIYKKYPTVWHKFGGQFFSPALVKFIEGRLVVTGFYDNDGKSYQKETGLKAGDIIVETQGEKIDDLVKENLSVTPASNKPTQMRVLAASLLSGESRKNTLKIQRGDSVLMVESTYFSRNDISRKLNKPDSCYRLIGDNIGYIHLGTIKIALLSTIFDKFRHTKGIVVDIRNYPSEPVPYIVGNYLYPHPTPFVKILQPDFSYPGLFIRNHTLSGGKENPDYYKGKVCILVNEETQSQAEFTTMAFRKAPKAVVMGSQTAGADGDVSPFTFPGDYSSMISALGVYYPDGKETQRIGIVPDIEVKPTIAGIRAGRDEVLERAMEWIRRD